MTLILDYWNEADSISRDIILFLSVSAITTGLLVFCRKIHAIVRSKNKSKVKKANKADSKKPPAETICISNKIKKLLLLCDSMSGSEFESFCAVLLKKNGYINVEATRIQGDYGADILAEKDGVTYAVQCKRFTSNIGNTAVYEINSGKSYYKRHVGIVLTNRYFTSSAKKIAECTDIILWDRNQLAKLLDCKLRRSGKQSRA